MRTYPGGGLDGNTMHFLILMDVFYRVLDVFFKIPGAPAGRSMEAPQEHLWMLVRCFFLNPWSPHRRTSGCPTGGSLDAPQEHGRMVVLFFRMLFFRSLDGFASISAPSLDDAFFFSDTLTIPLWMLLDLSKLPQTRCRMPLRMPR